ncbi:hypothetical protein BFN03_09650 [Rhodococcus sp. WMMA185]|uniref:hypothetical protein n=1 Tax=Rhodococcus sp. WMMA185 TaxID=679318 RepID=UPI000877F1E6|nr:hypothetical protein [Rhodococcus sp. WMMA185]AOW92850.1 hypothetical protein BFN03_09650 [Rhodococcus sp. WMMA185]
MTDDHAQVMEELRLLVEAALDRIEPIVQRIVTTHTPEGAEATSSEAGQWSGCSWCPVCALAAMIRGEQHDLVTLLASQASILIAMLRQILDEHSASGATGPDAMRPGTTGSEASGWGGAGDSRSGAEEGASDAERAGGSAFVPISVTIKT